jgi:hypothetical protein
VTLEELASHRSGLPRVASSVLPQARGIMARFTGGDPYPYSVDQLLDQARSASIGGRGKAEYRSFVALDRERGRAVVVLSDVASEVDDLGADLLREA